MVISRLLGRNWREASGTTYFTVAHFLEAVGAWTRAVVTFFGTSSFWDPFPPRPARPTFPVDTPIYEHGRYKDDDDTDKEAPTGDIDVTAT